MRIGLVGCVKTKQPSTAPAKELYTSPLFVGRRRYVEASCDRWFILSALHGLVDPDAPVEPYDQSLVDAAVGERHRWAQRVLAAIDDALGDVEGLVFEVHAGAAYRDFGVVDGLRRRGADVVVPAAGLSQGQQLAFYAGGLEMESEDDNHARPAWRSSGGASGYAPLTDWLRAQDTQRVSTGFADVEVVLARPLPASARRHRPWWGNNDGSPQARAWLAAGWRVAAVDPAAETVTFERTDR